MTMDRSAIASILRELNLNEDSVANIYNYGSWVYGTNSETSDRDLMIVTRSPSKPPLTFREDFDYFHDFELHKLWNQYDVCVHSVENFEVLLEKNYLLAIECIFLPDEFKLKEEIDFRSVYLEKYFDPVRLKIVAWYENGTAISVYHSDDESETFPRRSSTWDTEDPTGRMYLFKNLFHGFRYLDVAEQLIRTRSIQDFRRVSDIFQQMKDLRGDPITDENMPKVLQFIEKKSSELKSQIDALVPTNVVRGTFEAHVTFDCTHRREEVIERLKARCENSQFKLIFIQLDTSRKDEKGYQLMTSSYHTGEYPSILKKIEDEVNERFKDFNIIRIKIESLASNEGVPETSFYKRMFWDPKSTYFEFHYKVLVKKNADELRAAVRQVSYFGLHVSRNAFTTIDKDQAHFMITMRAFQHGRQEAFSQNEQVVEYLTSMGFPPLKVVREFVVYDSFIALDQEWH